MFNAGLSFYRKTFKRFRPLHVALNKTLTSVVLPLMEQVKGFKTIQDDPFWFRLELVTGRHERETISQLDNLVKPGMVVLDIGAHIGYYARRFSDLVGDEGRVVAFEPHPKTFQTLTKNVGHLDNVTLIQSAVSEEESTAELYDYLMMSASGSLHYDEKLLDLQKSHVTESDVAPRIATDFPVEKFTVQTIPVDTCMAQLGIEQIHFIKMDIEGAELTALRGMRQIIANSPDLALIMEYNPQALNAFGHDPQMALDEVIAMGFSKVQVIESYGTLTDITGDAAALQQLTTRLKDRMDVVNLLLTTR